MDQPLVRWGIYQCVQTMSERRPRSATVGWGCHRESAMGPSREFPLLGFRLILALKFIAELFHSSGEFFSQPAAQS